MIDKAAFFKEERVFSAAHRRDTCLWGPDIADRLVHSHERMNLWRPNFGFLPFVVANERRSPASSLSLPSSAVAPPTSSNVLREIGALEGGTWGEQLFQYDQAWSYMDLSIPADLYAKVLKSTTQCR